MSSVPQLHVFKVKRDDTSHVALSRDYVIENARRGIETSVLVDVNVIYSVRDVLLKKESLEDSGIDQFRNMLNSTLAGVVSGVALQEVPIGIRNECRDMIDMYLTEFCNATDHPTAVRSNLEVQKEPDYKHESGFFIETKDQFLPFYYITKMHQLWLRLKGKPRVEIFEQFLAEVVSDIDLLSALEVEIAKYCFCDDQESSTHESGYSNEAASKIAVIRKNFLGETKKMRTLSGRFNSIRNSVRDLRYLYMARYADMGATRNEEFWIATFDGKLAEIVKHFCMLSCEGVQSIAPVMSMFPQFKSHIGLIERPFGIQNKSYWQKVDQLSNSLYRARLGKHVESVPPDFMDRLGACLHESIEEISSFY